jgi:hypothetical protein
LGVEPSQAFCEDAADRCNDAQEEERAAWDEAEEPFEEMNEALNQKWKARAKALDECEPWDFFEDEIPGPVKVRNELKECLSAVDDYEEADAKVRATIDTVNDFLAESDRNRAHMKRECEDMHACYAKAEDQPGDYDTTGIDSSDIRYV